MVLKLDLTTATPKGGARHRYGEQLGRRKSFHLDGRVDSQSATRSATQKALHPALQIARQIATAGGLWLGPWSAYHYPGRTRILHEVFGRAVTSQSIKDWRSGRSPLPVWAALMMADAISTRAVAGLEIAKQLVDYATAKQTADDLRGANLRKARAAGIAPGGLGARGKIRGPAL